MVKRKKYSLSPPPSRNPLPFLVVVFVFFLALNFWLNRSFSDTLSYSDFLTYLQSESVKSLKVTKTMLVGELNAPLPSGKTHFTTVRMDDPQLVQVLKNHKLSFQAEPEAPLWMNVLFWSVPLFLLFRIGMFSFKRGMGDPRGGLLGLTRSKAKLYVEKDISTTFSDVAGVDEAKEELREMVSFLENPRQYSQLGGRAPKGILLVGPPGTGKTLLARAVAGEAKVPFLSINGSEFVEMFVGLGAARVRDLFQQSRELAPCILFIDEIDAIGKIRAGAIVSGGHEEKEQTLGQLLAEMDGFDSSQGVLILAATNRPEILDPALLRAGRFDRQVLVDNADQVGRHQILKVHSKKIKLDPEVKLERIAALTPGFSGADLANLVNEAALFATRRQGTSVTETDFEKAIERIIAGLEQKSKLIHPEEKKRIAFHEMGHATASITLGVGERLHKVSIIPRGIGALGYTIRRPTEDRYLMDQDQMLRKIAVLLGGRASERIFFDSVSTGAEDDLVKATELARSMVTRFGMSEPIGLVSLEDRESPFLPSTLGLRERMPFSQETAYLIDHEVKTLLEKGFRMAFKELNSHREFVEAGAKKLIEQETLEESELMSLWKTYQPHIEPSKLLISKR
ncbi:MAG: ATP-dependent zinc metalloprotease FtsH [Proteobacteria bacterium]|nr:ATP-dependent zinc metalloprotease FtsH [Pseudomonadota bacterium]